jgi:hypothetical protein
MFFELEISISDLRTHLNLFSVISEMKLRFFRRNEPEVNVALVISDSTSIHLAIFIVTQKKNNIANIVVIIIELHVIK